MPSEFTHVRRVEFADTDAAGIMHFSRFFVFMESAEHAFLRSLGASVHSVDEGVLCGWPRVKAECEYLAPLRFEEEVEIRLRVREKRNRSMAYEFTFHRSEHGKPGELVARGAITAVYIRRDAKTGKMAAAPIPDSLSSKIEASPPRPPNA